MNNAVNLVRKNIYLLEIVELFALNLLWIVWWLFSGRPFDYLVNLILISYFIVLCAWAFYLLMVFIWRTTSIWLLVGLAVLSGGIAIGVYAFLGLFDLNRLMLDKVAYRGEAPLEYFWNKESSENLREWKKARKAAQNPTGT